MPLKIYLFAIMKIFEVAYLPPTLNFDASNATFFINYCLFLSLKNMSDLVYWDTRWPRMVAHEYFLCLLCENFFLRKSGGTLPNCIK
jgi:hypothetical protein